MSSDGWMFVLCLCILAVGVIVLTVGNAIAEAINGATEAFDDIGDAINGYYRPDENDHDQSL